MKVFVDIGSNHGQTLKVISNKKYNFDKIEEYLNYAKIYSTIERIENLYNIYLINDSIYIFLKNSYILKFNVEGKIKKIINLDEKIKTNPIFVNGSIIYFNQNNNLIILD